MRGERVRKGQQTQSQNGSSPHARGTHSAATSNRPPWRFIPACAGNARPAFPVSTPRPVHPRMRGERGRPIDQETAIDGSSPHARGTHGSGGLGRGNSRFIPACAGNATARSIDFSNLTVHPRMRGERAILVVRAMWATGSSPHARGTHAAYLFDTARKRFIPACAGNAGALLGTSQPEAVHPRMRGERPFSLFWRSYTVGSSPHARGTRRPRRHSLRPERFIPACAGNAGESGAKIWN